MPGHRFAIPAPARPRSGLTMSSAAVVPLPAFNVTTAVLAAGFAFEAYNEPDERDARWERGADGCDVSFMSEEFARACYS